MVLTLLDTAEICLSTKLFIRLDLPAFGAPNKQKARDLAPYGDSLHGIFNGASASSGIESYGDSALGGTRYETILVSAESSLCGC